MALGDGKRRNIAHVSAEERRRFRDAIVELNSMLYPDGVSKWVKQDQIHQATRDWVGHGDGHRGDSHHHRDIHGQSVFLPWHRELCNNFELLLREVDAELSLHYWDWTEDPRQASDGSGGKVNLFTPNFMGNSLGVVREPFEGFPSITRVVGYGRTAPVPTGANDDREIIESTDGVDQGEQWKTLRRVIEQPPNHDRMHQYIGGTIREAHTAFEDPFVFLLHSNADRLWARWQTVAGEEWRRDPEKVYGNESEDSSITAELEPWAGNTGVPLRPWGPPENQQYVKTSRHNTVVKPPSYDTNAVDKDGTKEV